MGSREKRVAALEKIAMIGVVQQFAIVFNNLPTMLFILSFTDERFLSNGYIIIIDLHLTGLKVMFNSYTALVFDDYQRSALNFTYTDTELNMTVQNANIT